MLVLSRKRDEAITMQVGDKVITLKIVKIEPNKVRLGIEADKDVLILRDELLPSTEATH